MSIHVNGVSFACTMRGRICFGDEEGAARAAEDGCPIEIRARIKIDDSERFATGGESQATVTGSVYCEDLGGDRPVESGAVAMIAPSNGDDLGEQWLLHFSDGVGHPLTLTGHKEGLTMPVRVQSGTIQLGTEAGAPLVAAGTVAPAGRDVVRQFASMRGEGATLGESAASVRRVVKPYVLLLRNAYRGRSEE